MKKAAVKVRVQDKRELEQAMRDLALKFSNVIYQHDRVYRPRNYQPSQNFPRLVMRTEIRDVEKPAKYYLTLKRHIADSGVDIVDQTEVKDYAEAVNIIHQLGFGEAVEVSKRRKSLTISDQTMIYLDQVEGLEGYYLKIETVYDEKAKRIFEDLRETLGMFRQSPDDIVAVPYFELV